MYGKNPLRKQTQDDGSILWVQDIFYTIQGEGPYSGRPAVFIRLAGCNLRCWFCDTDFESSDQHRSVAKIVETVERMAEHTLLVVITGGEPMRQNITPLCKALLDDCFTVQIETAGTLVPEGFISLKEKHALLKVVCSPKTGTINSRLLPHVDAWKYIIKAEDNSLADGLPIMSTQVKGKPCMLQRPVGGQVYVSPMDQYDTSQNERNLKTCTRVALRFGYRMGIQLHKHIGVE